MSDETINKEPEQVPEVTEEQTQPEQASEEPATEDKSKCPACGSENIEKVSDYYTCKDCDKNFGGP